MSKNSVSKGVECDGKNGVERWVDIMGWRLCPYVSFSEITSLTRLTFKQKEANKT